MQTTKNRKVMRRVAVALVAGAGAVGGAALLDRADEALGLSAATPATSAAGEIARQRSLTPLPAVRQAPSAPQATRLPAAGEDLAPGAPEPEMLDLGGGRVLEVARGEVLLRFAPATPDEAVAEVAARHGLDVVQRGRGTFRARARGELRAALAALAADPAVASATPNAIARGAGRGSGRGADVWRSLEWETAGRSPGTRWWNGARGHARRQPLVALLDSGVAYEDHRDAGGRYALAPDLECTPFAAGHDFVNADAHPNDDHQHGTHLATLLAAEPDCGSPLSGYAPGVTLLPVKVLDADLAGTEMMLVEGLHFAIDRGADVINMSLAFGDGYFPSPALSEALLRAAEEGAVLVAAAGNDGSASVAYPAAARDVIAVGAFRLGDRPGREEIVADYSQRGPGLDVLGPGGDVDRDENDDGRPDGLVAQSFAPGNPTEFGYWAGAGTSQAAVAVSGLAARAIARGVPAAEVRALLVRHTDRAAFTEAAGRGAVRPDEAERAADRGRSQALPEAFVNLVGALEKAGDDVRARVALQVAGDDLAPLAGVAVHGHWIGAASGSAVCVTDGEGACHVVSSPIDVTGAGVLAGFHADRVVIATRDGDLPVAPLGFFRMGEAQAEAIGEAFNGQGTLAFAVDPGDAAQRALFGSEDLVPSAMIRDLGPATAVTPFVLVLDPPFGARFGLAHPVDVEGSGLGASSFDYGWYRQWRMNPTFGGSGLGASSLTWNWYGMWGWNFGGSGLGASSLNLGWFQQWSSLFGGFSGSGLGASSLAFPFGGWMFRAGFGGAGLGASSIVVNDYHRLFSPGAGFNWSAWGSGLGASSLNGSFGMLTMSPSFRGLGEGMSPLRGASIGLRFLGR